jgi:hypothetical protein
MAKIEPKFLSFNNRTNSPAMVVLPLPPLPAMAMVQVIFVYTFAAKNAPFMARMGFGPL